MESRSDLSPTQVWGFPRRHRTQSQDALDPALCCASAQRDRPARMATPRARLHLCLAEASHLCIAEAPSAARSRLGRAVTSTSGALSRASARPRAVAVLVAGRVLVVLLHLGIEDVPAQVHVQEGVLVLVRVHGDLFGGEAAAEEQDHDDGLQRNQPHAEEVPLDRVPVHDGEPGVLEAGLTDLQGALQDRHRQPLLQHEDEDDQLDRNELQDGVPGVQQVTRRAVEHEEAVQAQQARHLRDHLTQLQQLQHRRGGQSQGRPEDEERDERRDGDVLADQVRDEIEAAHREVPRGHALQEDAADGRHAKVFLLALLRQSRLHASGHACHARLVDAFGGPALRNTLVDQEHEEDLAEGHKHKRLVPRLDHFEERERRRVE
mmetsp:Transcript_89884/g.232107  ORF Transcript_89884/g.232107 Transcript_89884/m.232107 type:complete len:378 (-) Transcript_89884:309-1442(-)